MNSFYIKLLKLSWRALNANKMRSFLTTLGIVIGSATIIIVVALGEGAKADIEAQYSNMSVTTILINGPSTEGGKSKLSPEDATLISSLPTIEEAVPMLSGKTQMSTTETSGSFSVLGTYPEFENVANLGLVSGRFFTQDEEDEHEKVAVIGAIVAEELFGSQTADIVGESFNVGKKEFEIIGVAQYKGGTFGPITIDDSIFTPYSTSYRYILGKDGKFSINAQATDVDILPEAMDDIAGALRESHNIRVGVTDDFRLRDMGATVSSAQNSSRTMAFLLGSVGVIVLLVGGIGIMNIMFVTVTERTREIGIRKAIGAKDFHIMLQFLFEALILTLVGFITGAILAVVAHVLLNQAGFSSILVWWAYPLSFVVTVGIGVFFGYYPAKKASSLKPIDALRYE